MKIISKHSDYYDSIQSYGIDPTLQYKRESETFQISSEKLVEELPDMLGIYYDGSGSKYISNNYRYLYDFVRDDKLKYTVTKFKLGVCGYWYDGIKISIKDGEVKYFYQKCSELDKFPMNRGRVLSDNFITNRPVYYSDSLFIKYKSPILLIAHDKNGIFNIQTNVNLKNLHFQKIKDPFTLYQDIQNYILNFLLEQKELVTLTNSDKIIKAGFDKVTSFRGNNK